MRIIFLLFTICLYVTSFAQEHGYASFSNGSIGLTANPIRYQGGRTYDFSEAIKWITGAPPASSPYPEGSALHAEWDNRWKRHSMEGMKWNRFLAGGTVENHGVVVGTIVERRNEGIIISMPATKTIQTGSAWIGKTRMITPVYSTVPTTRQVLLRGIPVDASISLPVFAVPVGNTYIASAPVETFDYGSTTPPPTVKLPHVSATNDSFLTNQLSTRRPREDNVLKYYQENAEKGDAYSQYQMGLRYLAGNGVETNRGKAREYFLKAASQGKSEALDELEKMGK